MTSNDVLKPETKTKSNRRDNNNLKSGSIHANIDINNQDLDEILNNNNLEMVLAMQIISNDKTVRSDTVQDLREFNSQTLSTKAKTGEQLVSKMPAI